MPDILKNRRVAQASDLVVQALSWWFSELSSMFPWLGRLDSFKTPPALLRVGKQQCSLLLSDRSKNHSSAANVPATVELPGLDQLAASASRLKTLCTGRTLHVSMAEEDILSLEYELPTAARSELRQAVSYRLLTESPIDPAQVFFAVKPRKDASSPEHLRLDVVISRKEAVAGVLTAFGNCGVPINEVGYALPGSQGLDYVFHTSEREKAAHAKKRLHLYLLAMAVVVLTAYFPVTILTAKWLERDTRSQTLTLKTPNKKQTELGARQSHVQTVRQELADQLPPLRVTSLINEAASHLPPDAWVSRLEYANGKVSLAGQAANPSAAVRQLKKASLFRNAKLDAVSSAANPGEPPQFEISAVIAGGQN
jgi:hypothetical protein